MPVTVWSWAADVEFDVKGLQCAWPGTKVYHVGAGMP